LYPLCDRTVTVYRKQGNSILRQVIEGCYYTCEQAQTLDANGCRTKTRFLLVIPGDAQKVFVGDRVMDGIGPHITPQQWPNFLPVNTPTLSQVEYVLPCYRDGRLCHVEAGRK